MHASAFSAQVRPFCTVCSRQRSVRYVRHESVLRVSRIVQSSRSVGFQPRSVLRMRPSPVHLSVRRLDLFLMKLICHPIPRHAHILQDV